MSIEDVIKLARSCGYDGIQLYPIRRKIANQMLTGDFANWALEHILAAEMSWRSEQNLLDVLRHPNKRAALYSFMMMPARRNSVEHLRNMQNLIPNLPLVMFPQHGTAYFGGKQWKETQYRKFNELRTRLFQPTTELLYRTHEPNAERLVNFYLNGEGYDGVCLDTLHLREAYVDPDGAEHRFSPWRNIIPQIIENIELVHIRAISKFEGSPSDAEVIDLVNRHNQCDLFKMLQMILKLGYQGDFIVEIPADVIPRIEHEPLSRQSFIRFHRELVASLRASLVL